MMLPSIWTVLASALSSAVIFSFSTIMSRTRSRLACVSGALLIGSYREGACGMPAKVAASASVTSVMGLPKKYSAAVPIP